MLLKSHDLSPWIILEWHYSDFKNNHAEPDPMLGYLIRGLIRHLRE